MSSWMKLLASNKVLTASLWKHQSDNIASNAQCKKPFYSYYIIAEYRSASLTQLLRDDNEHIR